MVALDRGQINYGVEDKGAAGVLAAHETQIAGLVDRILLQHVQSLLVDMHFLAVRIVGQRDD